jgi:hypothetical protein
VLARAATGRKQAAAASSCSIRHVTAAAGSDQAGLFRPPLEPVVGMKGALD